MASALRSAILWHIRVPVTQSLAVNGSRLTAVRSMSSHGDGHLDKKQVIDRVLDDVKCFPKVDPSKKSNDALVLSRRGFHVEPGPREKALLVEDPSLKRFKSHKQGVRRLKVVGDILTIAVVAGWAGLLSPRP
ncbi:succinate dehydrogenase subunit [Perilla frutescens var. hirtella]|uniref:Succinate dehydrogenase subunit n=1 Tax=Perilla frutescens var. hirtella TaxID=608512 RepID=A0AAD4IT68_PERFH|nr:succinate dehydrogenase subunit [Perilla frutescens var. hirtella]